MTDPPLIYRPFRALCFNDVRPGEISTAVITYFDGAGKPAAVTTGKKTPGGS